MEALLPIYKQTKRFRRQQRKGHRRQHRITTRSRTANRNQNRTQAKNPDRNPYPCPASYKTFRISFHKMQLRLWVPSCSLPPVCHLSQSEAHNNNVLIEQKTQRRIQWQESRDPVEQQLMVVGIGIRFGFGLYLMDGVCICYCSFAAASRGSVSGFRFSWSDCDCHLSIKLKAVKGSRRMSTCQAALFGDFCSFWLLLDGNWLAGQPRRNGANQWTRIKDTLMRSISWLYPQCVVCVSVYKQLKH